MTYRSIVLVWLIMLLCSAPARAEDASFGACELKLATGRAGKGFSKLFRDIQSVCGEHVRLCEVETAGGLDNLGALSANKADLGFVQVDTLLGMKGSDENIAALQCVMSANTNLLHVLTLKDGYKMQIEGSLSTLFQAQTRVVHIERFSSLKRLPVALVGTAQWLGRTLDKKLELGLQFVDVDSDELAIVALRAGEVAAIFSVSGWPSGSIEKLAPGGDLTVVPYDLTPQAPQLIVRKNYPNLGVFNNPFLGLPSVLVTRPFSPGGARGKAVSALRKCLVDNLEALREGSYDPAWKELSTPDGTYGLPRFAAPSP